MFNISAATIDRISANRRKFQQLSDSQLRQRSLDLKYQASTGRDLRRLIPQSFALVIEASSRTIGMTPYQVQIFGAIQIAHGHIAEMKTGEGKTLTATMPVYLHALAGRGAHVATVNDYLAHRDHGLMSPVYELLGLSVGVVQSDDPPHARQAAYQQDITYATAKEFGFDFLRDRLKNLHRSRIDQSDNCHRELNFVLVDEADSILIDEARTPLIIGVIDSQEANIEQSCFRWAARHAELFKENVDYKYDHDRRAVELLAAGHRTARNLPQTGATRSVTMRELYRYVENALKVHRDFELDKNYVVRDGKIAIVDEFTGRVAEGRQWQAGIHQSVEARENLDITASTRHGATITLQSFFNRYKSFAGMTGTAWSSRNEFRKVYHKKVIRIATNQPVQRTQLPTVVFTGFELKMAAVVDEIKTMAELGRSVLVGTRSIEKSQWLSELLLRNGIKHEVLNANNLAREAEIVAGCGQPGRVTVATNMAGRGTDILLSPEVLNAGGLHVILTELHESQRIDWQLIGRGSRQGDPGSFRIFVALDDELLNLGLGLEKAAFFEKKYARFKGARVPIPREAFKHFITAQSKMERKHLVDRMILRKQDKEKHERQFDMGLDPYCEVMK